MKQKNLLRKKYLLLRKKKYFEVNKLFFNPIIKLIKSKFRNKKIKIGLYFPSFFELNVLKILELKYISDQKLFLPIIEENNTMNFFPWKKNEILFVNKYGILEPRKTSIGKPNIILVPLLVFDKSKSRLGYGKGFYDRYLKKIKNTLTVGVAFSFQKYHKLPINKKDIKLDYILTEKGII